MGNERDEERKSRLAAALRENLKRRKQQMKGRAGASAAETGTATDTGPEDDCAGPAKEAGKPPN